MADDHTSWWPKGFNKWGFNPRKPLKPQLIASAAQMTFIFGGPLVMIYVAPRWWPLVEDRTLETIAAMCIGVGFVASLAVIPRRTLPPKLPLAMAFLYRLSLGFCFTTWVFDVVGIANGYRTQTFLRDVPIVAKHQSLGNPSRRASYVSARPWSGSRSVVDIEVNDSVYDALDAPITVIHAPQVELEAMPDATRVRLVLGRGRFGFDWIKSAEPLAGK